jgi:GxxExxY protein
LLLVKNITSSGHLQAGGHWLVDLTILCACHRDTETQSVFFDRAMKRPVAQSSDAESTYEECLDRELRESGLVVSRQLVVPLTYRGKQLASTYRLDLIVESRVIVEVKAVDTLARVHLAQMLSYLHHTGLRVGLILNFNSVILRDGVKRVSL